MCGVHAINRVVALVTYVRCTREANDLDSVAWAQQRSAQAEATVAHRLLVAVHDGAQELVYDVEQARPRQSLLVAARAQCGEPSALVGAHNRGSTKHNVLHFVVSHSLVQHHSTPLLDQVQVLARGNYVHDAGDVRVAKQANDLAPQGRGEPTLHMCHQHCAPLTRISSASCFTAAADNNRSLLMIFTHRPASDESLPPPLTSPAATDAGPASMEPRRRPSSR